MMLHLLSGAVPAGGRVLDLGCGTGSLSERILARFPEAEVVAVDHAALLLRIGSTGLGSAGGRLTWVDADLREPAWTASLPRGRFDAIVSSTALHWLSAAEIGRLYRDLAPLLRPGGLFLNADHIASGERTPRIRRILLRAGRARRVPPAKREGEGWRAWWQAALADPHLEAEARLHRRRYPRAHSRVATADLPGHRRRLRAAGFREVAVLLARGRSLILAAVR